MNSIACIFCNKSDHATVIRENGYDGKKCFDCNLIYISPRPHPNEITDLYGHNEAYLSAENHISQEYTKRLHARHYLSLIKKHKTQGSLLEIGAGAGYFLDEARIIGFEPYAIEPNRVQADFISSKLMIPCDEIPLHELSFGDKKFDVIFHSDVASHLYDPIEAFKIMHSKLNEGGYLIFETGNIGDMTSKDYNLFNQFQYPDHLFFFGESSLKKLLAISSFNLKAMHHYAIWPQLSIMRLINKMKKKNPHNNVFLTSPHHLSSQKPLHVRLIRNFYHFGMHHMRYTAGRILPKNSRAQTIIVIAQK
jgi:SAM-dependent methyltransferase